MSSWTAGLPDRLVLEVGQERRVPLAPAAGGYEWSVTGGDEVVVAVVEPLPPAPVTEPPASSPGDSQLVLTPATPGTAVLSLVLRRPWGDGTPLAEHPLTVTVSQTSLS